MREQDRLRGGFDGIHARSVPAMGDIDDNSQLVHFLDKLESVVTEARAGPLQAAIAHQVPPVIGELNLADAEIEKHVEVLQIRPDGGRVLKVG